MNAPAPAPVRRYDAVVFDLLTALLDSWSLWNAIAGSVEAGLRWRREYLRLTYGAGRYRDYEALVSEAAVHCALPAAFGAELVRRWDELEPWPDASATLGALRALGLRLAVVTNCSEALGHRAVARVGATFDVVVTAERAGFYKPAPAGYETALAELGVAPGDALFVAGSPNDIPGASAVGMDVFWHDRLGLPMPEGVPSDRLVGVERTLARVVATVR